MTSAVGRNAALALASGVLALAALEAGARVAVRSGARRELAHVGLDANAQYELRWRERSHRISAESSLLTVDPLLGWRPKPRTRRRIVAAGTSAFVATINRDGLRGKTRIAVPKPAGRPRIGIFGCSQTFGAGVDDGETFAARLGASLPGADVLNFGVSGYGTDQMLLYYETAGARYDLDVVVLAFAEYHLERNVLRFRSYAKPVFALEPDGGLQLSGVPIPAPDVLLGGPPVPAHTLLDRSVLLRWLSQRREIHELALQDRAGSKAWELTRALVARFAADARQRGTRMVLVNVDRTSRPLDAALADLATAARIDWIDLDPAVRAAERDGRAIRLPHDRHFDPAGHRLIADTLRTRLCGDGLVACGGGV